MDAHVIWYRSRPSEGINARLRRALSSVGAGIASDSITIKADAIPAMLAKAFASCDIVVVVGGMDIRQKDGNIVFILSKCLSLPLETGSDSRSKFIYDPMRGSILPSFADSVLFPSRVGGPEGMLVSAGTQTLILLPWLDGANMDILDFLAAHLPKLIDIPEEETPEDPEVAALPDYIRKAVEKHSEKRIISDAELSPRQLRKIFARQVRAAEAVETNLNEELIPEMRESRSAEHRSADVPDNMTAQRFHSRMPSQQPKSSVSRRMLPFLRAGAVALVLLVIIGSLIIARSYESGLLGNGHIYQSELAELYSNDGSAGNLPEGALSEFSRLYGRNDEVRGFISIPGTNLSQPIMYSQEGAPDKYSSMNFYHTPDPHGSLYFDVSNTIEKGVRNYNLIVYGNSPEDGSLFSALQGYRNADYLSEHPVINLDTLYERGQWRIFAVCIVSGDTVSEFNYTDTDFTGKNDNQIYLYNLYIRSLFYTSTDVFPTDRILTLCTDSPEFRGAKLLVCARKVREDEDISTAGDYVVENDRVMMPDLWYTIKKEEKPVVPAIDLPTEATTTTTTVATQSTTTATTTTAATTTTTAAPTTAPTTAATNPTTAPTTAATTTADTSTNPTTAAPPATVKAMRITSNGKIIEGTAAEVLAMIAEAEISSDSSMEAIKAQVVAAYTFYLYSGGSAKAPSFPTKKAGDRCKQAAAAVAGQYITYNDRVPYTPYYAISAGATANNADINGDTLGYLTAVDCSVDESVSGFRTVKEKTPAEVAAKVKAKKGIDLTKISDKSQWFEVLERDTNGLYVKKVKVGPESYRGNTLHLLILGYGFLRSPCFWIEYDEERDLFVFTSLGYGTGVGMSQTGANEYAKQGKNYAWILQHFYPGTKITS